MLVPGRVDETCDRVGLLLERFGWWDMRNIYIYIYIIFEAWQTLGARPHTWNSSRNFDKKVELSGNEIREPEMRMWPDGISPSKGCSLHEGFPLNLLGQWTTKIWESNNHWWNSKTAVSGCFSHATLMSESIEPGGPGTPPVGDSFFFQIW